jgi:homoserine trans-succinylase
VGLLNLMPDRSRTETQFARLLGASCHNVELVLALPRSYRSTHEGRFYERWSETSLPRRLDGLIITGAPLELAQSLESGLCLVADAAHNSHYMFNHLEYDADTLKLEYLRDRVRRAGTTLPIIYLPNDDLSKAPPLVWRRPAEKFFANWLSILTVCAHQTANLGRSAA